MKVEQIFECFDFNKRMNIYLVTLEFSGYAFVWWNQVLCDIRRMRRPIVETWSKLKKDLRGRFMPSYYARYLYISYKEYHKEMELCLIRAQVEESQETTMARFLHGLNREIQDIAELHHYHSLEDLIHQTTKVELQLKRKITSRKPYLSSNWKGKEKERPRKDKSSKKGSEPLHGRKKEKAPPTP
ncbi:hypothetical protein CR513_16564, partial [Mucuna pruriens]